MRVGEERLGVGLESLLGVESLPLPILATSVGCGMRVPECPRAVCPRAMCPHPAPVAYIYTYIQRERERDK
jgi:hypothetical protein